MSDNKFSRRGLLKELIRWPAAGSLLFLVACSKGGGKLVCADPSKLTPDETSLRTALHYIENAPQAGKTCSGCGFFTAAPPAGCGQCQMLKGVVNSNGHCDSWSARA